MATIDIDRGVVPRLENGDRLTRSEFERRYAAMPDLKKAELCEGVVYMASAVRAKRHGQPHALVMTWLGVYAAFTPKVMLLDNATVRLDLDNEAQPDALLRLPETAGSNSRLSDDDYIEGPPEFVAEIAASSASYDLHDKLRVYRRNGVKEYLVWRILERELTWFCLEQDSYVMQTADEAGVLRSRAFPGLWLSGKALVAGDAAAVLGTLQEGLKSDTHVAFAERLRAS